MYISPYSFILSEEGSKHRELWATFEGAYNRMIYYCTTQAEREKENIPYCNKFPIEIGTEEPVINEYSDYIQKYKYVLSDKAETDLKETVEYNQEVDVTYEFMGRRWRIEKCVELGK